MSGRRTAPLVTAGTVLLGFLVLLGMWLFTDHPASVPGLWAYPSAYLGDGVLLPVAAGLLVAGVRRLPAAPAERAISAGAGLVAGCAAVGAQALWLRDDAPGLNWTLPRPHHLTPAGWWHAGYFVAAAGLFAVLLALVLRRLAAARGPVAETVLGGAGTTVALCALLGYAGLAARDSSAATLAARASLTTLAAATVLLGVVAALALRGSGRAVLGPAGTAVVFATGVSLAPDAPWSADRTAVLGAIAALLTGAATGVLALVPGRGDLRRTYGPDRAAAAVGAVAGASAMCVTSVWVNAAMNDRDWPAASVWLAAHLAVVVIVPACAVRFSDPDGDPRAHRLPWLSQARDLMIVIGLLSLVPFAAVAVRWWSDTGADYVELSSLGLAVAVTSGIFPVLRERFILEADEERHAADATGSYALDARKRTSATAALVLLVMMGVSGGLMLLAYTLAAAADRRYLADSGMNPSAVVIAVVALLVLGLLAVLLLAVTSRWAARGTRRPGRATPPRVAAVAVVALWPATLVVAGAYDLPPLNVIGLAGGLLLGAWSVDSVVCNAVLFAGVRADRPARWIAAAVAASGLATGYFALTAALGSGDGTVFAWGAGIGTATAALGVHAAICVLAGRLAAPTAASRTRHGASHNLIQDSALMALLYSMALVIPATTMLHLPATAGLPARVAATALVCGPFLAYFLVPYQWLLRLNAAHLDAEIDIRATDPARVRTVIARESHLPGRARVLLMAARRACDDPRQHRFLRVLSAHIGNQNAIGRSVVAVSVVGLLVLVTAHSGALFAYLRRYERDQPHRARPATRV